MRLKCPHCQEVGTITNSAEEVGSKDRLIYLNCKNINCNARTVHRLAYMHDIIPALQEQMNAMEEMIAKMDPDRRAELMKRYGTPA
jgi:Ogr/Delta-like zinc finger